MTFDLGLVVECQRGQEGNTIAGKERGNFVHHQPLHWTLV